MKFPVKQGDLDNLCGLYALVNALHFAELTLEDQGWYNLTAAMADAMESADVAANGAFSRAFKPSSNARCGLRLDELLIALKCAGNILDASVKISRFKSCSSHDLTRFWGEIASWTSKPRSAAILAFIDTQRGLNHWIAADLVTPKTLRCRDSLSGSVETRRILRTEACIEGYGESRFQINPRQSLLLRVGN